VKLRVILSHEPRRVILKREALKGSLSRQGRKSLGWTAILSSLRDSG
jgi:hypothetical protein